MNTGFANNHILKSSNAYRLKQRKNKTEKSVQMYTYNETAYRPFFSRDFWDSADAGN